MLRKDLLKGLSEEQIAKVNACKSHEEVLKVAKEEGIELSDEQLAAVSGGGCWTSLTLSCPECDEFWDLFDYGNRYECGECGCWWNDNGIIEHGKKYKGQ